MNDEKLLPCPFCGLEPDIKDEDTVYPVTRDRSVWNVCCIECAGGCSASVLGDSASDAIKNWNTRVK